MVGAALEFDSAKSRRHANQIFIKTIARMIQGASESSLGSLEVVLLKDKLCV